MSVRVGPTIGYTDYTFGGNDNIGFIGIGIGISITYRLGSGKKSVIPIVLLEETILSVSLSVSVSHIG